MRASPEFHAICEEWLKKLHTTACVVVASGEQHVPMLVLKTPEGDIPVAIAEMMDANKSHVAALHRTLARDNPVCLITEAWTAAVSDQAEIDRQLAIHGRVRDMPGRRECIMFNFMSSGMQLLSVAMIERRDGDDILEPAAPLFDPAETGGGGTFMLSQQGPLQ